MEAEYQIIQSDQPDWKLIGGGINQFNLEQTGDAGMQHLCFVLRGPDQEALGGVIGEVYWGWLYVNLMWLKPEARGRGFGSQLLASIEDEARRRGAKNVYLDTFSFQAPEFYKKYGYRVFGQLENFPAGQTRYFLTKAL